MQIKVKTPPLDENMPTWLEWKCSLNTQSKSSSRTNYQTLATPNTYKLEVNRQARLLRQRRVFRSYGSLRWSLTRFKQLTGERLSALMPKFRKFSPLVHLQHEHVSASIVTPRTIQERIAALSVALFIVTGFMVNGFDTTHAEESSLSMTPTSYVVDQDGYFTKANPQTFDGERTVKDKTTHIVEPGENISVIASNYGLKAETVLWENGLSLSSTLQIGQKLVIPPVDGVSYTVNKGDTIEKIASKFKAEKTSIIAHNSLVNDTVTQNQVIFIPGAKPLPVQAPSVASSASYRNATTRGSYRTGTDLSGTDAKPTGGHFMIFPTIGSLTQGFHSGHYAFDIANRSQPPIWAAAAGTVVKASSGTWGGGYGNHVIIDHGNGVQTLYAHMEYITVKVGDKVTQGQVVGKMGHTGNVRGVTGIHLHFEVIDHGKKKVPSNYY